MTLMAIMQGTGQGMQAAGGYLAGGEERKKQRWQFGQMKDLYDLLRWQTYGKQGPVISPQMMNQLVSQYRKSMQPAFADMSWGASRGAGLSSPQSHRLYAKQRMPLEGGFIQALMQQNIGMTQQRDQNLLRLMAGLAGGS
jgi:hypothetical protein